MNRPYKTPAYRTDPNLLKRCKRSGLFFVGLALAGAGFAAVESVDPRFPSELRPAVADNWSRWPWVRIGQLEAEREQLLETISGLPQHNPKYLSDRLGYHSTITDPLATERSAPHQIDITFPWLPDLDSIALVPAFCSQDLTVAPYAFPKRFKIEVLGQAGESQEIVNWMDEDFPDPGPYPVFFSGINRRFKQLRISVPQRAGDSGAAYFALAEIYMFQRRPTGVVGDNMAGWGPDRVEVTASDSLEQTSRWGVQYLIDGVHGLGFALSDEKVAADDFRVEFPEGVPPAGSVQFILDMGTPKKIGLIDFWPASAPQGAEVAAFGFPQKISVKVSNDPDFKEAKRLHERGGRGSLVSVLGKNMVARYVLVTLDGFPEHEGKPVLGLGEISVRRNEHSLSEGCKVIARGLPDGYQDQLPLLVDDISNQRRILSQVEWIKGLAQRRPLDRRLALVERELGQARKEWQQLKQQSMKWGSVCAFLLLAGVIYFLYRSRKATINKLRWRITRDLHDDVGSTLGGISLAAEEIGSMSKDGEVKEELDELMLMAREAFISLREVVWFTDKVVIYLPALLKRLEERAERMLKGVELSVQHAEHCPDKAVSLEFKRHLIMFFWEMVSNCARHAQASRVRLVFSTDEGVLKISLEDDGCGFDPETQSGGWGLESLKKRATEIGGEMILKSRPGEGTVIELSVPFKLLSGNPGSAYKTSN